MIGLYDMTYLTMPKPRLMMTTSMRASALFMHDTSSANTTAPGTERFIQKVERKIKEFFLRKQHFSRTFHATAKIKHVPFKLAKMDAVEHGQECLLTTYCDEFSQSILLIKLLAALLTTATFLQ